MSVFRFWKPSVERDIDDELRFHFDARIEELAAQGKSREAARVQALDEFGDVNGVRQDLRAIDSRVARRRKWTDAFDGIRQDVVYAARSLRGAPAVSLTVILTLALGLGVNTTMFSLLDAIFLRPPAGVASPADVRRIWAYYEFRSGGQFWSGYDYTSYAALQRFLSGRADLSIYGAPFKVTLGRGENLPTVKVSTAGASYFSLLGVRPALGRFFDRDEDRVEVGMPVAVISDRFWHRAFGAGHDAIGMTLILEDKPYTIIGVTPPGFSGVDLDAVDAWLPLAANPAFNAAARTPWYQNPNINGFQVLLRLRPVTPESELEQRATLALRQPGIGYRQDTAAVARFGSIVKARGPGKIVAAVQVAERAGGVAILVLLIAFANVVNLLLARAVRRRREIAVRLALGISSSRLVRLLVTESVMLSLVAAVAALAGAWWGGALLRKLILPEVAWAADPLHWRVLLFGATAALVAGAASGLLPALQSLAPDLTNALKSGSREGSSQRSRLRSFLVASQAALSVVLIVGAALFIRSLSNVRGLDIGYAVNRLAFVSVDGGKDKVRMAEISNRLLQLEERIASVPGVERVAYTSMRPKWGIQFQKYFVDGETREEDRHGLYNAVSPGFFAATGTRVIRGRSFSPGAAGRAERAILVNTTAVDSLWPNQDPLGRCIRFRTPDAACYSVIGVTQQALQIGLKDKPEPHFYLPIENMPFESWGVGDVVLRLDPARLTVALDQVRAMLREEFRGATVTTNTMAAAMEPEYRPWRLGAILFSLFGALAAVVAAIGVYSTVSYAVSQRTHEFGVRLALGATARGIAGHVVGDGVRTVAIGVLAGIAIALAGGRLVASLLYGVSPTDPVAMATAAGALLVIAVVATFAPAWRAGKSDPVSALRAD